MTSDVIFVKVWFERRARHSYTRYTQPQLSIRGKSFREKKDLKATFCFLKHSHGCQECTFVTRTMCSLTNHMDAEHGKTCPNCDRKFPNQVSLDKHIDSCTLVVIHTVTTMFLMKTLWWWYTIICVIIAIRLSHRKVIYWSTSHIFPQIIVWFVNRILLLLINLQFTWTHERGTFSGLWNMWRDICYKIETCKACSVKHEDDHYRILCNLYCSNLPTKTRFRILQK